MKFSTSLHETYHSLADRLGKSYWWAYVRAQVLFARHDGYEADWILENLYRATYSFLYDFQGGKPVKRTVEEMAHILALTLDKNGKKWVPDLVTTKEPIMRETLYTLYGEKAQEVFQSQAAQGYRTRPAKGYRKSDETVLFQKRRIHTIEIDPPNAIRIQMLFRLVAQGTRISDAARTVGFNRNSAWGYLINPVYAGYIQYKGTEMRDAENRRRTGVLFPGRFVPLLSVRLYNQVASIQGNRPLEETWEIIDSDVQIPPVWENPVTLWMAFDVIPVDDQGCIQQPFLSFETGTQRQEVESWFESEYGLSVAEFALYADRLREVEANS